MPELLGGEPYRPPCPGWRCHLTGKGRLAGVSSGQVPRRHS
jgi:hypothetical protein